MGHASNKMMGERTQPGLEHLKVSVEEAANAKLIVENIDQFDREIEFERVRNSYLQVGSQPSLPFGSPARDRMVAPKPNN
jgi:predicted component of viral defense system (DUF524 family)